MNTYISDLALLSWARLASAFERNFNSWSLNIVDTVFSVKTFSAWPLQYLCLSMSWNGIIVSLFLSCRCSWCGLWFGGGGGGGSSGALINNSVASSKKIKNFNGDLQIVSKGIWREVIEEGDHVGGDERVTATVAKICHRRTCPLGSSWCASMDIIK